MMKIILMAGLGFVALIATSRISTRPLRERYIGYFVRAYALAGIVSAAGYWFVDSSSISARIAAFAWGSALIVGVAMLGAHAMARYRAWREPGWDGDSETQVHESTHA